MRKALPYLVDFFLDVLLPLSYIQLIPKQVLIITDQHSGLGDPVVPFVHIDPALERIVFRSDPALLRRVIGNLVKNAIEAFQQGETVTVGVYRLRGAVEFRVHNQGSMSRDVRLQVFQRSFSTKGAGRGLGTYSAKLLTERYLKGNITFTSSIGSGTTFRAVYPLGFK